jgi:hypothetical protein
VVRRMDLINESDGEFKHKTYAEYLAAVHLVRMLASHHTAAMRIFATYRYEQQFTLVFEFAAGIASRGDPRCRVPPLRAVTSGARCCRSLETWWAASMRPSWVPRVHTETSTTRREAEARRLSPTVRRGGRTAGSTLREQRVSELVAVQAARLRPSTLCGRLPSLRVQHPMHPGIVVVSPSPRVRATACRRRAWT